MIGHGISMPVTYDRQFIVVSHIYTTGPAFQLTDYLRQRAREVIFIGHPFSYATDTRSFLRIYRQGVLVEERKFWRWRGPDLFFYLKDVLLTFWWVMPRAHQAVFVGIDNLNACTGYLLQRLVLVQTLIFYTIDYIPQRFANFWLNRVYHWLDRTAIKKSHRVWNLSPVMVDEREKRGVAIQYRTKQITVPIGTVMGDINNVKVEKNSHTVVFLGHLRPGQGVDRLLEAIKLVEKVVPSVRTIIIGGGSAEESLRTMAETLGLSQVHFTGLVEQFSEVLRLLGQASIAVAPYVDDESTYTRFTDPGKPKDYLACGLPVVITRVPHVAQEIADRRCGLVVDDTPEALADAIIRLLSDNQLRQEFRTNALRMAADYTWDQVFDEAFSRTL
jgi:glycosyltransferase involved in cell wall biosynthesis